MISSLDKTDIKNSSLSLSDVDKYNQKLDKNPYPELQINFLSPWYQIVNNNSSKLSEENYSLSFVNNCSSQYEELYKLSRLSCFPNSNHLIRKLKDISSATLSKAYSWILESKQLADSGNFWWDFPLVNIYEDEVVFEWWYNSKKITVYISSSDADFIKVWGSNIHNEMEDGKAVTSDQINSLWKWLVS